MSNFHAVTLGKQSNTTSIHVDEDHPGHGDETSLSEGPNRRLDMLVRTTTSEFNSRVYEKPDISISGTTGLVCGRTVCSQAGLGNQY